jgi:formate-dependent nitrite reductase cytochrome c552 subunit
MKKCSKCGDVKEYVLFNKHSGKRDGYASNCKECDKQSRIDRAAKIREYNKSESRKKSIKDYKKRNEDYYREYGRVYNSV